MARISNKFLEKVYKLFREHSTWFPQQQVCFFVILSHLENILFQSFTVHGYPMRRDGKCWILRILEQSRNLNAESALSFTLQRSKSRDHVLSTSPRRQVQGPQNASTLSLSPYSTFLLSLGTNLHLQYVYSLCSLTHRCYSYNTAYVRSWSHCCHGNAAPCLCFHHLHVPPSIVNKILALVYNVRTVTGMMLFSSTFEYQKYLQYFKTQILVL